MTCTDYFSLILCSRSHDELTRAERQALLKHLVACPDCLVWTAGAWLRDLHDRPEQALAHLVDGMQSHRTDLLADDPEAA
jgi:hypothetical protein